MEVVSCGTREVYGNKMNSMIFTQEHNNGSQERGIHPPSNIPPHSSGLFNSALQEIGASPVPTSAVSSQIIASEDMMTGTAFLEHQINVKPTTRIYSRSESNGVDMHSASMTTCSVMLTPIELHNQYSPTQQPGIDEVLSSSIETVQDSLTQSEDVSPLLSYGSSVSMTSSMISSQTFAPASEMPIISTVNSISPPTIFNSDSTFCARSQPLNSSQFSMTASFNTDPYSSGVYGNVSTIFPSTSFSVTQSAPVSFAPSIAANSSTEPRTHQSYLDDRMFMAAPAVSNSSIFNVCQPSQFPSYRPISSTTSSKQGGEELVVGASVASNDYAVAASVLSGGDAIQQYSTTQIASQLSQKPECSRKHAPSSCAEGSVIKRNESSSSATIRKYACTFENCNKSFMSPTDQARHLRVHTGEKPYVCGVEGCERTFSQKHALARHEINSHMEERPFSCEQNDCRKKFSSLESLKLHQRIHSGDRPFKCSFEGCTRDFVSSNALKYHQQTHDREALEGVFKCYFGKCSEKFSSKKELNQHKITSHKETSCRCDYQGCERVFDKMKDLEKHKSRIHINACSRPACAEIRKELQDKTKLLTQQTHLLVDAQHELKRLKRRLKVMKWSAQNGTELNAKNGMKRALASSHEVNLLKKRIKKDEHCEDKASE